MAGRGRHVLHRVGRQPVHPAAVGVPRAGRLHPAGRGHPARRVRGRPGARPAARLGAVRPLRAPAGAGVRRWLLGGRQPGARARPGRRFRRADRRPDAVRHRGGHRDGGRHRLGHRAVPGATRPGRPPRGRRPAGRDRAVARPRGRPRCRGRAGPVGARAARRPVRRAGLPGHRRAGGAARAGRGDPAGNRRGPAAAAAAGPGRRAPEVPVGGAADGAVDLRLGGHRLRDHPAGGRRATGALVAAVRDRADRGHARHRGRRAAPGQAAGLADHGAGRAGLDGLDVGRCRRGGA